jgi:methionine synthase II (cobalamin-independent)
LSAPGSVAHLREAVDSIVDRQIALGIDIVNDGALSKGNWFGYLNLRLSGFEQRPTVPGCNVKSSRSTVVGEFTSSDTDGSAMRSASAASLANGMTFAARR